MEGEDGTYVPFLLFLFVEGGEFGGFRSSCVICV